MSSPDLEFQTWIKAQLDAQFTLDGIACGVTAHPLPDAALPFIDIGQSNVADNVIGHEIRAELHIWSAAEGSHETKNIMHSVRGALHGQTLTQNSWRFTCVREEYSNVILDRDGEHWHGIMRIRVLASEA